MKKLHCPTCGSSFVRATYCAGVIERLLSLVNLFPFRCQLCTNRFRLFYSGVQPITQMSDRRQYTRLAASIEAQVLDSKQPSVTNRITDISMDGCTLQTTGLQKGAFIELVLKPTVEDETIRIHKAMVCSVRPSSIGIRFLDVQLEHHRRLTQVVLGLLVGQGLDLPVTA
ncbi:MAG: PilZ domain-containing protein [Nitrospira sp.]